MTAAPTFFQHERVVSGVTRSISGHLTEGMQRHYATVSGDEQRRALAKVIDLTTRLGGAPQRGGQPGHEGGEHPRGSGEQMQEAG
jgi:hypothetical protein